MVSTSGNRLISQDALDALGKELLPLGKVITPNIHESEILCGFAIEDKETIKRLLKQYMSDMEPRCW